MWRVGRGARRPTKVRTSTTQPRWSPPSTPTSTPLSRPRHTLADALVERSIAASGVDGWSAVEAINVLRGRFAGEAKAPLAITGRWSTRRRALTARVVRAY